MPSGRDKISNLYDEILGREAAALLMEREAAKFQKFRVSEEPYRRPELDAHLQRIIRTHRQKQNRQRLFSSMKKAAHKAAIFAGILVGLFSVMYLTVDAFRVQVNNLFVSEASDYMSLGAQASPADMKAAGFTHCIALPEGYSLMSLVSDKAIHRITYTNPQGAVIVFEQHTINNLLSLDTDNHFMPVQINGHEGYAQDSGQAVALLWEQDGYFFSLYGDMDMDTAMQIAESLYLM